MYYRQYVDNLSLINLGKTDDVLKFIDLLPKLGNNINIKDSIKYITGSMEIDDLIQNMFKLGLSTDDVRDKIKAIGLYSADVESIITSFGASGVKSFKNIGDAINGFLLTPLGKVVAVATAAALVIGAIDLFTTSPAEATEKMNESFSEFQDAQQKVSDLNSELETAKNRINELEAKGGLTFVEQTELEKLRESVRLLQIQADLAEKEAIREGKESVRDTVTAYEKNFKHDISAQDTQSYYQDIFKHVYADRDLFASDVSNISSMIASIKYYEDMRAKVSSDGDWEYYTEKIQSVNDSVWEQVDVLSEYKSKLEAIPKELLTDYQSGVLDDITSDIEYVYKELDPASWKQIKLDEILSKSTFSDAKNDLVELAKSSDNVGVSASDVESYFLLNQALKAAGITAQEFADIINSEAGILDFGEVKSQLKEAFSLSDFITGLTGTERNPLLNEFNNWIDDLSEDELEILYKISLETDTANWTLTTWQQALIAGVEKTNTAIRQEFTAFAEYQETVSSAISSSSSATGLASEEITNLTNAYKDLESFDAEKLFEQTANGIHLNERELKRLNEELESAELQKYADEIKRIQSDIYLKRSRGEDTTGLEAQLADTERLKAQYEGLTSAYNDWLRAKEGPNERDSYAGAGASYEEMKSILDQGWYGDESLNEYLDMMLSADQRTGDVIADFEKLTQTISGTDHSIMDYWQYDDSGNLVTDGLFDFLDDVNLKFGDAYATISENGEYAFDFTGDKLQEVAAAFGMSTEMVELFVRAMIDAGMAVNMGDLTLVEQIEKATEKLKEFQEAGKISDSLKLEFDVDMDPLEDVKSSIDNLKSERLKIDADADPELAALLDDLIAKCEAQYYFRLNAETDGGLDTAVALVREMQALTATPLTVEAQIANEEKLAELAGQLAALPTEVQTAVGVKAENIGSVEGIINQLNSAPESITVPVNYSTGEQEKPNDEDALVDYGLGEQAEPVDKDALVNYKLGGQAGPLNRIAFVDYVPRDGGTAHADGTAINAHANGHDWTLPKDEDALVNEIGTESIVRDGKWRLIPGGAHIEKLKRGDIIFSAKQTEELIKSGRVTSGGGHGRIALAGGTLNAYDGGTTGDGGNRRPGSVSSYTSPSGTATNSTNTVDVDDELEKMDWIEVALDRIQRAIEKVKTTATSAYKSIATKLSASKDEISLITKEIGIQQSAYDRYMQEANSVGLSSDLANLVQTGAIDISQYDEETQELIKSYTEWFEKALDCDDAIQQLHEDLASLYEDNFNNIKDDFDNQLELLEHMTNTYENGIDMLEAQGYLQSTTYYAAMQDVKRQNIAVLNKELASIEKSFSEAMASGEIEEGSEAW